MCRIVRIILSIIFSLLCLFCISSCVSILNLSSDFFDDGYIAKGTYICEKPYIKLEKNGNKYKDDEILWKYAVYGEIEMLGETVEFIGIQSQGDGQKLYFWTKSYVIEKGGKDYEIKSEDAIFIGYSENLKDGSVRIKNSLTGDKFVLEKVD